MPRESTWTPPSAFCPNPQRWTASDNHATEDQVIEMVAGLIRGLQPDYVIETGTYDGRMAYAIGDALARNGHGHLETIEVDSEARHIARERCEGLPVTCHLRSSMDFDPILPIDFAWFDSLTHLRWPEFLRYWPKMHDRTVVGFHDTAPQHGDWSRQIRENSQWLDIIELPTPRGVVLGRVRPHGIPLR